VAKIQDAPEWQQSTPREKAMARMGEEMLAAIQCLIVRYDLAVLDGLGAATAGLFVAYNAAIDFYAEQRPGQEEAVRERLATSVRLLVDEMEARPIGGEEAKAPAKDRQARGGEPQE
jgi:hypothetical protein